MNTLRGELLCGAWMARPPLQCRAGAWESSMWSQHHARILPSTDLTTICSDISATMLHGFQGIPF